MNIVKKYILLLLFLAPPLGGGWVGLSQTIDVELSTCGGSRYTLSLMQGTRADTVADDYLDLSGKATIVIPAKYATYRGVGRLSVEDCRPNISLVLGGEQHFSLRNLPGTESVEVVYENSPENSYVDGFIARQKQVVDKYGYIAAGQTLYGPQDFFSMALEQERAALENSYRSLQEELRNSPLQAARIVELLNLLTGTGSALRMDEKAFLDEQRTFITERLNFKDLYTSGFWQPVMDLWYQVSTLPDMGGRSDSQLLAESRSMLDRAGGIPVRRELTESFIRLFSKYGKDTLLLALGTEYLTMPLNGQPAPELHTDTAIFRPAASLIVFYDTECSNCHYELEKLKDKYRMLADNQIRVITIAADTDRAAFEGTSKKLPWPDKLCDYKGFDGENFLNYGIVGTPTFILTDKEGIVRGRYAQLKELFKD